MQLEQLAPWRQLQADATRLANTRIDALFDTEKDHLDLLSFELGGIYADLSKNLIDAQTHRNLIELAQSRGLADAITALFEGDIVNPTEMRPALHTLLRNPGDSRGKTTNAEKIDASLKVRQSIKALSTRIREGKQLGFSGLPIRDVVNIGIGGSHLGPQLVCEALRYENRRDVDVHFVSNVDVNDINQVLAALDPATTLFIVSSKSFTTAETLTNARTASAWIQARFDDEKATAAHFIAVTAKPDRAQEFGIAAQNILPMWDWVGGRYSLWSAIGLSIAVQTGYEGFESLLNGAHAMDEHFRHTAFANNLPVMLALLAVWNSNFLQHDSIAVVPYDDRLGRLSEYLQQLEMESNGKRVQLDNSECEFMTSPVIWGGVGTNVQHAFFQQLHQGTRRTTVDFIIALKRPGPTSTHQDMLVANCFAQAEGLMRGRDVSADTLENGIELDKHRNCPGNRGSNMFALDRLSPENLGALLAMYEHKTFVQAVIWGINPFDQWGVELGKALADDILAEVASNASGTHDASTTALIERYRALRK